MTEPISIERPKCSGLDCDGFAILNGMCAEHYWQANAEAQVRYQRKHAEAKECPKYDRTGFDHGPAQAPHTCPFRVDINDDTETLCECCPKCEYECAMDI